MAIQAIVFDVGGVLERVASPRQWMDKWKACLDLTDAEFAAAEALVDPDGLAATGQMTEHEYRQRTADAFALLDDQLGEFMHDIWTWYCGELDQELMSYAVFDPIIYSHEVGLMKPDPEIYALTCTMLQVAPQDVVFVDDWQDAVDGANTAGMTAALHRATPTTIQTIDALLARDESR